MPGFFIACLLVVEAAAIPQAAAGERFQIVRVIRKQKVEILRPVCRGEVRACTHFVVGEDVVAACVERNGRWSPVVRGHAMAFVEIEHEKFAGHELKHVDDVQAAISARIEQFESARYESNAECEAAHERPPDEFRALIRTAAAASFAKRR